MGVIFSDGTTLKERQCSAEGYIVTGDKSFFVQESVVICDGEVFSREQHFSADAGVFLVLLVILIILVLVGLKDIKRSLDKQV